MILPIAILRVKKKNKNIICFCHKLLIQMVGNLRAITERSSTSFLIFLNIAMEDQLVPIPFGETLKHIIDNLNVKPHFTILLHTSPEIANARQQSRNRPGEVLPPGLNQKLLDHHYNALSDISFLNKVN